MLFVKYYILFSICGLTILATLSLRSLFKEWYEKTGLVLLWFVLIFSIVYNINELNLLWLAPLSLFIPYFISRIFGKVFIKRFKFALRNITSIFF